MLVPYRSKRVVYKGPTKLCNRDLTFKGIEPGTYVVKLDLGYPFDLEDRRLAD